MIKEIKEALDLKAIFDTAKPEKDDNQRMPQGVYTDLSEMAGAIHRNAFTTARFQDLHRIFLDDQILRVIVDEEGRLHVVEKSDEMKPNTVAEAVANMIFERIRNVIDVEFTDVDIRDKARACVMVAEHYFSLSQKPFVNFSELSPEGQEYIERIAAKYRTDSDVGVPNTSAGGAGR